MKRWKKVLITCTCLFLLLIIGGVMYVNYYINHIILAQIPQHVIESDLSSDRVNTNTTENTTNPASNEKKDIQTDSSKQPINKTTNENNSQPPVISSSHNTDSDKNPSSSSITENNNITPIPNTTLANTVQQEVGKPIETADLFQAGFIVLKKLGKDEINFLFGFSHKSYTNEELVEVRRLLLSKLNDQDINTLRALGQKYGKKLEILDPNVPIK